MWVLHCHARIASYRKFDRFICSCASILIATKVGEALRNTTDIIKHMRVILRAKKQISAEDSEDSLARYARKVFEAEIHIMINLGFDFDIETGLASLPEIYEEVKE